MTPSTVRLRLIHALLGLRLSQVSQVGHSIGSTVNIGFGATVPRRYAKRRIGNRRTGYFKQAERDLFLSWADWEIRRTGGYRLRSSDNQHRIASEIWFLL